MIAVDTSVVVAGFGSWHKGHLSVAAAFAALEVRYLLVGMGAALIEGATGTTRVAGPALYPASAGSPGARSGIRARPLPRPVHLPGPTRAPK